MPRPTSNVWDHFLLVSENGIKKNVTCNYCNTEYKYAQANRLKEHLVKCKNSSKEVKKLYSSDNKSKRVAKSTSLNSSEVTAVSPINPILPAVTTLPTSTVPLPTPSTSTNSSSASELNITESPSLIIPSSNTYTHKEVDTALARAIYATGVPLSLLESEYWQAVFKILDPSYTVPSRHLLSNPLLEAEYTRVKQQTDRILSEATALGLTCDGWTNNIGKGVINFMITTPKPIFYYNAIYPETEKETGLFLSEKIINIIIEIGPAKFVAVITDNAANMKLAWRIITAKFPHISCVGCVSHSLNLIYKDIFKILCFKEILDKVTKIIKYVKNSHVVKATFEKSQTELYGRSTRTLKLFSKTRWSGAYISLQSCKENREALESLAISHEVNMLLEMKNTILNNQFWDKIEEVVRFLQPFAIGILQSEKNDALLSDVPSIFSTLKLRLTEEFRTAEFLSELDKAVIVNSIEMRKDFCVQPIHYAAHQLDPRYCGEGLSDEEIAKATEYLRHISVSLSIDAGKVLKNMAEFRLKENFFDASKAMWIPVKELEPRLWWRTFASQQDIATIATNILSVPPSSAASERNWSLFSRTHTKKEPVENGSSLDISEEDIIESEHSDHEEVMKEDPLLI